MENWKSVNGFPDYNVSDSGRVMRITRGRHTRPGRLLKQQTNRGGYPTVGIRNSVAGTSRTVPVHCLVAAAFLGPRPAGYTVNHKDGNKRHNRADNLEYLTVLENIEHAKVTGLILSGVNHPSHLRPERLPRGDNHHARRTPEVMARGERHGLSKFTAEQVVAVKIKLAGGASAIGLAREYNVSEGLIQGIKHGRTWRHVFIPPQVGQTLV